MKATPSHKAVMRRYWSRRAAACRRDGLCVRCREKKVPRGAATCEGCRGNIRLARKLREVAHG